MSKLVLTLTGKVEIGQIEKGGSEDLGKGKTVATVERCSSRSAPSMADRRALFS